MSLGKDEGGLGEVELPKVELDCQPNPTRGVARTTRGGSTLSTAATGYGHAPSRTGRGRSRRAGGQRNGDGGCVGKQLLRKYLRSPASRGTHQCQWATQSVGSRESTHLLECRSEVGDPTRVKSFEVSWGADGRPSTWILVAVCVVEGDRRCVSRTRDRGRIRRRTVHRGARQWRRGRRQATRRANI